MHRNKDAVRRHLRERTILKPGMGKAHYGLALAYQELGKQDGLMEEYRISSTVLTAALLNNFQQTFQASTPCSRAFCN